MGQTPTLSHLPISRYRQMAQGRSLAQGVRRADDRPVRRLELHIRWHSANRNTGLLRYSPRSVVSVPHPISLVLRGGDPGQLGSPPLPIAAGRCLTGLWTSLYSIRQLSGGVVLPPLTMETSVGIRQPQSGVPLRFLFSGPENLSLPLVPPARGSTCSTADDDRWLPVLYSTEMTGS